MVPVERLVASLSNGGQLCDQCLSRQANLSTDTLSTAILELRQHVAVGLERGACAECNEVTWVCSLRSRGIRKSRW